MNQWGAFVFFVAWCIIALIYSYIMVPETAGRALENINELFEHPWYMMRKHAVAATGEGKGDVESYGVDGEEKGQVSNIEYAKS